MFLDELADAEVLVSVAARHVAAEAQATPRRARPPPRRIPQVQQQATLLQTNNDTSLLLHRHILELLTPKQTIPKQRIGFDKFLDS